MIRSDILRTFPGLFGTQRVNGRDIDVDETITALANGTIKPQPMVTDVITVDEVPKMFELLKQPGGRAKVLVEFPH